MELSYDLIRDSADMLIDGTLSSETFFEKFGLNRESLLNTIIDALNEAIQKKDGDTLDNIVYIIFYFDLRSEALLDIYNYLLTEKWHYKHEDLVTLIDTYRSEKSLEFLYKAAVTRFEYLTYDDDTTFALTSKCIHAIGNIGTNNARKYLTELAQCGSKNIAEKAQRRLNAVMREGL